ncbi:GerAB/ArcD/ProY family transporter [Priestia megaterium]|uniref:GerAB/ArcD/ProY family transporter n=1 Tax=Priestia megaterium TaxID=1404 RepID=UPI0030009425
MEKAKISASQLFILMVLFELGSSLLVPIAMDVKQDAWLAILLGMVGSFVLFLVYNKLHSYYPDLLPTEYMQKIMGFILIVCSGLIKFINLQPVLEEGVLPVLKVAFTQTIYFPFAEAIVFTMILPYLKDQKKAKLTMLCATGLSGINLTITMLINISVLGVDLTARSQFPLLSTVQSIQVADFLERLDVFFMLALVIGGFIKISVLLYAAVIGTANLFKIKSPSRLSYPLGFVILCMASTIASNFQEHLHEGLKVEMFILHMPILEIIPPLLLLVAFLKNRKKQRE